MVAVADRRGRWRSAHAGLTYIEVLVSTVIVASALVPTLDALRTGASAGEVHRQHLVDRQRLLSRMEEVLANRFATLDQAAGSTGNNPAVPSPTYSDPAGAANRIVVVLYRYDGTNATTTNSGLVRVDASIPGSTLSVSALRTQ